MVVKRADLALAAREVRIGGSIYSTEGGRKAFNRPAPPAGAYSSGVRAQDLYDWLLFRSKTARERRDLQRLHANNLEMLRQRQAHYRAVTQSDATGHVERGEN